MRSLLQDGSISERGSYEEWRVSEKRYRIALHNPALSVEEYGTDHGVFRTGGPEWPREPLGSITGLIARPVWPPFPEDMVFENVQRRLGGKRISLYCGQANARPHHSSKFDHLLLLAQQPHPSVCGDARACETNNCLTR